MRQSELDRLEAVRVVWDGHTYVEALAVSVPDAAKLLGVSKATIHDQIAEGRLPLVKIGRRGVVPVAALRRLLAGDVR